MKRWQLGQVSTSLPVRRLFAICGAMLRWHPLHVIPTTGTTAIPPRCLRIRSYRERSDRSTTAASLVRFSASLFSRASAASAAWRAAAAGTTNYTNTLTYTVVAQ